MRNIWGVKSGYLVSWTVEREYKRQSSRLVYRQSKSYEKHFLTAEEVVKFLQKKKKEWERKQIKNSLCVYHVESQKEWHVGSFETDIPAWADKYGFLKEVVTHDL